MKSFWKSFFFIHVALMVLVMSWEQSKTDAAFAAVAGSGSNVIPQESIRLRILADSDAPADQILKRRIRDAVIESMNAWVTGPQTLDEARQTVRSRLPELELLVGRMVKEAGFDYSYNVDLGVVQFPTKVYGDRVYPAGAYEALRITLGSGLGQNWWCVLFPPLCFVDVAAGEAPKEKGEEAAGISGLAKVTATAAVSPEVEYRFFLLDWFSELWETVQAWFA
ncbi:stage II sporulation protein R [Paenibacillus alkalitolerans]|uniref:stage II sporulation protein R n=1 Tax=Paenibacillus alkalitolerans TaxID=2799335 RepID=UPI0018F35675|nr:stage II sporulation protein R [Paenibacillus alkalitolerans]